MVADTLNNIYYNLPNPASYAGARRIIDSTKNTISRKQVETWLRGQDAYTLHRPVHHKFQRQPYIVPGMDSVWEGDLIELESLKSYNDGYSYLLVVIDVLSKFAWVRPLKNKTSLSVTKAFEDILSTSNNRKPILFQTDAGKEFIGAPMQSYLKSQDIKYRTTRNPDIKAAIVERFNRTLKERIWRYFTHKNTKRYIEILPDVLKAYNDSIHSTIKMAPSSVNIFNAYIAKGNMDSRHKLRNKKPKYSVGDLVRISKTKATFSKGYTANWSTEIFKIIRVLNHRKPIVYEIEDLNGEVVDGLFYEQELTVINKDLENETFQIDEILETKGTGKRKKYLVSWVGYPSKFNSWVSASDLKNI